MTELQGYGADTWCFDSLSPGRFATGPMLVAQACYRRLITPRGMLAGDDDASAYGFDVAGHIGAVGNAAAIHSLPGLVSAQLGQDDRIAGLSVTAAETTAADGSVSIELEISASLADESGTFTLTLAVSDVGVSLIGVVT